uniref:Uncharacterized protein n=1 Tax=Cajanus cajan TaxID=3821 RepID=A0A151R6M0_CAJCA|nr:hypothetical protein KK1_040581 [Cajanus cajan]
MKELLKEAKSVIGIPTFQIIVAQGVFGSFPWSGLSFATLWLELIGFSHVTTATLWTLFIVAASFGSLFGGWMGDFLSQRLPNSGRIILSQISAGSAIPLAAILLLGLPDDSSTAFVHGLVLILYSFYRSWNAPATNNPIFIYRENAASLAKALYTAISIPAVLSFSIYSFLYCTTYSRDRERAKMVAFVESEMQRLEEECEIHV